MNDFENIKSAWQNKEKPELPYQGHEFIIEKTRTLNRKQLITKIVLSITIVVLIIFFISVAAYKNSTATIGLMIMIISLLLRVVLEFIFRFKSINETSYNLISFKEKFLKYHKQRLWINFLITPILFILYIVGFISLLPSFKSSLSSGFYNYILYSSWVIFIILGLVIWYSVRKEQKEIKRLVEMSQANLE